MRRAVKIMQKSKMSLEEIDRILGELKILKRLDHPHILKVLDFFDENDFVYIVTELCTGGELFDKICKEGKISEKKSAYIMR